MATSASGIVGHADCTLGDPINEVLEALIAAGGGRFRGIRHHAAYDADVNVLGPIAYKEPGLYVSDAFRAGFRHLADYDLSFDAMLVEPQLPDLIDLARRFPNIPIILNHVGAPLGLASYEGRREERFPVWLTNIKELAKSPNVSVKLGGLANPALHVRKQLPDGRKLRLRRVVERLQGVRQGLLPRREDRPLQRHGGQGPIA